MSAVMIFLCETLLVMFRMSMQAIIVAFPALLLMMLFRRIHAPQWINFLLFGLIALRLIVPLEFSSPLSIYNTEYFEDYTHQLDKGFRDGLVGDYQIAVEVPGGKGKYDKVVAAGVEPETSEFGWRLVTYTEDEDGNIIPAKRAYDVVLPWVAVIWVIGIAVYLLYGLISYLLLLRRLRFAVKDPDVPPGMNVWLSDKVKTPCLVGLFHPRIILPFGMTEQQRWFVLCHEYEHLRHGDHWCKLFSFLLMSAYWYHYLIWGLYTVFLEELELACDARVLRRLGAEVKADYSEALVDFSVKRRFFSAVQIAFGENYTKERVQHVLRWKKTLHWLAIPALFLCVLVGMTTLTSAADNAKLLRGRWFGAEYMDYAGQPAGADVGMYYHLDDDLVLYRAEAETHAWQAIGQLAATDVLEQPENFMAVFDDDFDAAELNDHAIGVYRITEPGDTSIAWMFILLDDNRVFLARMDGFMTQEGHVTEMYQLSTGLYEDMAVIPFPLGEYEAAGIAHWGMWSSLSPDYAWAQMMDVRIAVDHHAFEASCTGEATAELWGQLPISMEYADYVLEIWTEDIPATDDGDMTMLPVLEGTSSYMWRILDYRGEETGWRLLWHNGHVYAGYWRPFGAENQTMACTCLFLLQPVER